MVNKNKKLVEEWEDKELHQAQGATKQTKPNKRFLNF